MRRMIDIEKAGKVEAGEFVLVPQNGMGILLAREVKAVEPVDGGKWVEITTDDGLRHLVGLDDLVAVVF